MEDYLRKANSNKKVRKPRSNNKNISEEVKESLNQPESLIWDILCKLLLKEKHLQIYGPLTATQIKQHQGAVVYFFDDIIFSLSL